LFREGAEDGKGERAAEKKSQNQMGKKSGKKPAPWSLFLFFFRRRPHHREQLLQSVAQARPVRRRKDQKNPGKPSPAPAPL
jgi:hypothetical protein